MLAVVKMPGTEKTAFKLVGNIDKETLQYLSKRFGKENIDLDGEVADISESSWFKNISKQITPGVVVKTYRENLRLTQKQLAEKSGISKASYISDIENGRRSVSRSLAKKFSALFSVPADFFL